MKRVAPLIIALALVLPSPVAAHDEEGESIFPNEQELRDLGRLAEQWMRNFAEELAPMAERLQALIDDLDAYEAPEMMPNGDIIIRRKPDAPPPASRPGAEDEGGISL